MPTYIPYQGSLLETHIQLFSKNIATVKARHFSNKGEKTPEIEYAETAIASLEEFLVFIEKTLIPQLEGGNVPYSVPFYFSLRKILPIMKNLGYLFSFEGSLVYEFKNIIEDIVEKNQGQHIDEVTFNAQKQEIINALSRYDSMSFDGLVYSLEKIKAPRDMIIGIIQQISFQDFEKYRNKNPQIKEASQKCAKFYLTHIVKSIHKEKLTPVGIIVTHEGSFELAMQFLHIIAEIKKTKLAHYANVVNYNDVIQLNVSNIDKLQSLLNFFGIKWYLPDIKKVEEVSPLKFKVKRNGIEMDIHAEEYFARGLNLLESQLLREALRYLQHDKTPHARHLSAINDAILIVIKNLSLLNESHESIEDIDEVIVRLENIKKHLKANTLSLDVLLNQQQKEQLTTVFGNTILSHPLPSFVMQEEALVCKKIAVFENLEHFIELALTKYKKIKNIPIKEQIDMPNYTLNRELLENNATTFVNITDKLMGAQKNIEETITAYEEVKKEHHANLISKKERANQLSDVDAREQVLKSIEEQTTNIDNVLKTQNDMLVTVKMVEDLIKEITEENTTGEMEEITLKRLKKLEETIKLIPKDLNKILAVDKIAEVMDLIAICDAYLKENISPLEENICQQKESTVGQGYLDEINDAHVESIKIQENNARVAFLEKQNQQLQETYKAIYTNRSLTTNKAIDDHRKIVEGKCKQALLAFEKQVASEKQEAALKNEAVRLYQPVVFQANDQSKNLMKAIKDMEQYANTKLAALKDDKSKAYRLAALNLAEDLTICANKFYSDSRNLKDKAKIETFKQEFNKLLHSKDSLMGSHRNTFRLLWRKLINQIVTVLKKIHLVSPTNHYPIFSLFGALTKREKCLNKIDKEMLKAVAIKM